MDPIVSIGPPKNISEALERITARDRVFFEEHRSRTQYKRPYQEPEFWPIAYDLSANIYVEVTCYAPGIRSRRVLGDPTGVVWDSKEWLGDLDFGTVVEQMRNTPSLPEGWQDSIRKVAEKMVSDAPKDS